MSIAEIGLPSGLLTSNLSLPFKKRFATEKHLL